jgi:hypothetical protein
MFAAVTFDELDSKTKHPLREPVTLPFVRRAGASTGRLGMLDRLAELLVKVLAIGPKG